MHLPALSEGKAPFPGKEIHRAGDGMNTERNGIMNKQTEKILDGLRMAMEAELTGHQFYKAASRNTKDQKGKETFSRMADEEMGHFNYLRHQYQSILKNGEYDFTKKLPKGHKKSGSSPIFSKEIQNRIKTSHFEVSALTIGMKLEMEAAGFYRKCAAKAATPAAKKFYTELAEWEQGHYDSFKNQLDLLKEEYFAANHFVPM
jgi:rubrerythrin